MKSKWKIELRTWDDTLNDFQTKVLKPTSKGDVKHRLAFDVKRNQKVTSVCVYPALEKVVIYIDKN